jgi:hypothetical protein
MTRKFAIAVTLAARSPRSDDDDLDYFPYHYASYLPANSLEVTLQTADIDSRPNHGEATTCSLEGLPPITALAVDFSNAALSLYPLLGAGKDAV